jgi:DNA (cytosine-5)-methyltransferase 1
VLEVSLARVLTGHVARPHSDRDLRDFSKLMEGENSGQAIRRGISFEFPYDKASFRDRYTRQHRNELCSTIVAHLSKDGLMFIHPTQNRSLTPREAARVQSFPDWFEFPTSQTHQFKLIGNAVPPLVAEALGNAIDSYLRSQDEPLDGVERDWSGVIPSSLKEAAERLMTLVRAADKRQLFRVSREQFLRGWCSVGFLYPDLHPDSALEKGNAVSRKSPAERSRLFRIAPRLAAPFHLHSGWPVAVVPVVREAWRRLKAGQLEERELYCSEAVLASADHFGALTGTRASSKRRALA